MPYPRFEKLAFEKRQRLMEVAAQEFAGHGFEEASLNHILERAQLSKGVAYYYFEDKVDLFCTVVQYCSERLKLIDTELDLTTLSAENFWPKFAELHRLPLLRSIEQPWLFATLRVVGRLPAALLEREALAALVQPLQAWVMAIVRRGQELGVIRADIADDLIFAWLQALDGASDAWLLARWEQLDAAAIAAVSDQTVEAMRRVVMPAEISNLASYRE
jgi:AcrR family transcriptional regulator